jgi:HlyD family secretion protein
MNVVKRHQPKKVVRLAPPVRRRSFIWLAIAGVIVLIVGVIIATMVNNGARKPVVASQSAPVATVTTQMVGFAPVETRVTASGSIAPQHAVDIGAEVSGLRITAVNVDEGDFVRKGQVIARLNSEILQAQLSSQQAQLGARRANVSKARQPNRSQDIAGLRAAVSQAEASVTQAQANLNRARLNLSNLQTTATRYDSLGKEGAISVQEALDKRTAANMAASEVESARQQLEAARFAASQSRERYNMAVSGGRQEDVAISLSDLAQTQAAIRQVQAQIDQTILRAPSDGLITKRMAEVGEISMAGQAMFSMTRDSQLELQAQVQEVDLPKVRGGQTVVITPASADLPPITGVVREVSPRVDARTRLGIAYVLVPASSGLKEGMYANATITTGAHQSMIVPTRSVLAQEGGKVVFILVGDRVSRRSIQTGSVSGDNTEVISGLQPGDRVVVAGAGFLKDGDRVNVQ